LQPPTVGWANLQINAATGEVTITTVPDSVGIGTFAITADDAHGGTHSENFQLMIRDVAAPLVNVGVLQDPVANGYLEFYLFASEKLAGDPGLTLSAGTQSNAIETKLKNEISRNSYYGSAFISGGPGQIDLQVNAKDIFDNDTLISYHFAIQSVAAKALTKIPYPQQSFYVLIPENSILIDDQLLISEGRLGADLGFLREAIHPSATDEISEIIHVQTRCGKYAEDIVVGFEGKQVDTWLTQTPGFYRYKTGRWEYLPTYVSESQSKIWCYSDEPGIYVMRKSAPAIPIALPDRFTLRQNYPNPFNAQTVISFNLPGGELQNQGMQSRLTIYNLLGQEVGQLIHRELQPGSYTVAWDGIGQDGRKVSSGVYLYVLQAGSFQEIKKMVLMQ